MMTVKPKKIISDQGIIEWVDENGLSHHNNIPALIWFDGATVWQRHGNDSRAEGENAYLYPAPMEEITREDMRRLFGLWNFSHRREGR